MPERKVVEKEEHSTAAFRTTPAATSRSSGSAGGWADLEERVGANWLNRIGTVVLVIGMALFLNYSMQYLGKGGKVAVAYTLGAALLALGAVGERRDRYRIIARALIGGGWAMLYATTYAMHHVEAVKLIESSAFGFALLFSVAAVMVIHSLRYDSELITGFAYGLGVASVVVSRLTAGTIVASVVLAVALVILLWRKRWYRLEPGAVAAAYGVHALWLWQIFNLMGGKKLFGEYQLSVALLTTLWMIFTVSHFLRPEGNLWVRRLLTFSFLLNAGGYLAVMRYQSFYPDLRFWFLLGCGVVYLALSAFARKRTRQLSFILSSTMGALLLFAAIPNRFEGARLEIIWILEAEAFLIAGWRLADPHLRKLGWLGALAPALYVTFHDLVPRLGEAYTQDFPLGALLLVLAAAYLSNSYLTPERLGSGATRTDRFAVPFTSPLGAASLAAAAWVLLPSFWVVVAWMATAWVVRWLGRRLREPLSGAVGHVVAMLAVVRLFAVNLWESPELGDLSLRMLTVTIAGSLLFLYARWIRPLKGTDGTRTNEILNEGILYKIFVGWVSLAGALMILVEKDGDWLPLSAAALVLALAGAAVFEPVGVGFLSASLWLALPSMWTAPAWVGVGFLLRELPRRFPRPVLEASAHGVALVAVIRFLVVNLREPGEAESVSLRLLTVGLGVILYYFSAWRIQKEPWAVKSYLPEFVHTPARLKAAYSWVGTGLAVLLIWSEVTDAAVGLAWGLFALALAEVGRAREDRSLTLQGFVVLALTFVRIFMVDFHLTDMWGPVSSRLVTVVELAAIYYYVAATAGKRFPWMGMTLFWFAAASLAGLLHFEIASEWVVVAWAGLAFVLYLGGRSLRLSPLRYQAYLVSLMVGGRFVAQNFQLVDKWEFTNIRTATVAAASILLFLGLVFALLDRRLRPAQPDSGDDLTRAVRWIDLNAHYVFFFIPVGLLTWLLRLEVPQGYLTAAWGLEGFLLFAAVLKLGIRAFRLFGLGLLLLCVLRIVLVDVWALDPLGRIISFVGLGVALLLVSWSYVRFQETLRKYL